MAQEKDALSLDAFSINVFCKRNGISRATFYNLHRDGLAPQIMKVGARTLISAEAAQEWRRRMELESQSQKKWRARK